MTRQFIQHGLDQMPLIAETVISYGHAHKVWIFTGDIGSGKTTLIRAICQKLGVTDPVTSPTFSLVNTYSGQKGNIHHFDWYRIRQPGEALEVGWEDYLDSDDLLLVEWPEKISALLPDALMLVRISGEGGENRSYTIELI